MSNYVAVNHGVKMVARVLEMVNVNALEDLLESIVVNFVFVIRNNNFMLIYLYHSLNSRTGKMWPKWVL